jgi:hypothetical protein
MKASAMSAAALSAVFAVGPVAVGAAQAPMATFAYSSTSNTPNGAVNVACTIAIATAKDGNLNVTVTMPGKPPVKIKVPAGGAPAMAEPQGGSSQQLAQLQLILERVAMIAQLKKAKAAGTPLLVQIPVLPPGAAHPLRLPATFEPSGNGALSASATVQTSATIDTQKAKIHGILPVRRIAERLKNAVQPKTVTVPDNVRASVRVNMAGNAPTGLIGNVTQTLSGNGKSVDVPETWTLTKT